MRLYQYSEGENVHKSDFECHLAQLPWSADVYHHHCKIHSFDLLCSDYSWSGCIIYTDTQHFRYLHLKSRLPCGLLNFLQHAHVHVGRCVHKNYMQCHNLPPAPHHCHCCCFHHQEQFLNELTIACSPPPEIPEFRQRVLSHWHVPEWKQTMSKNNEK